MSRQTDLLRTPHVSASHPASPWQGLSRKDTFHSTPKLKTLLRKATDYVRAGVTINLAGSAGLGKTTLALRIAEDIGRPVAFMTGNQWLTTKDFVGREVGQTERTVIDKYVQSVRRTETESRSDWKSAILALSMQRGYTLVYDEFTRASPEANSALLSVLEEGVLVSTDRASDRSYISAHEDFRIILTSNPHDYAGVHNTPDAVMDRVVTLALNPPDTKDLAGMVAKRTGIDGNTADVIARLVTGAHSKSTTDQNSTLRSAVMIARIAAFRIRAGRLRQDALLEIAGDILTGRGLSVSKTELTAILMPEPQEAAS